MDKTWISKIWRRINWDKRGYFSVFSKLEIETRSQLIPWDKDKIPINKKKLG